MNRELRFLRTTIKRSNRYDELSYDYLLART
jgi:hypothetical protein